VEKVSHHGTIGPRTFSEKEEKKIIVKIKILTNRKDITCTCRYALARKCNGPFPL
jgi:hypothetical protein